MANCTVAATAVGGIVSPIMLLLLSVAIASTSAPSFFVDGFVAKRKIITPSHFSSRGGIFSEHVATRNTPVIISTTTKIRMALRDDDVKNEFSVGEETGDANGVLPVVQLEEKQQEPQQIDIVDSFFQSLDKFNEFLDQPFFDPQQYEDDDSSFFGKFANLVKSDYELFEAVFVACFFLILITIAKDVLRAEVLNSAGSGRLF